MNTERVAGHFLAESWNRSKQSKETCKVFEGQTLNSLPEECEEIIFLRINTYQNIGHLSLQGFDVQNRWIGIFN